MMPVKDFEINSYPTQQPDAAAYPRRGSPNALFL
jgi:hypothetical protein